MPRGDKSAYTDKQKRQAEHIEEGYEKRGLSEKEAERRAWATVNDRTGGGKKSGSGARKRRPPLRKRSVRRKAPKNAPSARVRSRDAGRADVLPSAIALLSAGTNRPGRGGQARFSP